MALTTYTAATDIIKTLGTNPEDRPTLTDDTFKAKFDENAANIAAFLNAMIAELASTAAGKGASQIGIEDSGSKFTAATVEAALAEAATLISTVSGNLGTHTASTSNPHSTTAAQVGALPITGGTITGVVTIDKTGADSLLNISTNTSGNPIYRVTAGGVNAADIYFDRTTTSLKIKSGSIDALQIPTTTGNINIIKEIDGINGRSLKITAGAGSPEGVVTANVGSLFLRSDGGTSTTLYVKQSGTGNTGWVAK